MTIRALDTHWLDRPWRGLSLASRCDPFGSLHLEFDRLFAVPEHTLGFGSASSARAPTEFSLKDEGEQFAVSANLAGLKQSEVTLTATAQELRVRGERKLAVPEGFSARRRERRSYTFDHCFRLPMKIAPERVEAKLKNGVLTVKLPKATESIPRNIAVSTG